MDDLLNISVVPKPKKKKGQLRMFYDESFQEDALIYVRPDDPEKPEDERADEQKLRNNIKKMLDKKKEQAAKLKRIKEEEEQAAINESVNAESFFDIKSPDPFLDDEDDEDAMGGKSNNNPFSLRSATVRDIDENDEYAETEGQQLGLGFQDSLFAGDSALDSAMLPHSAIGLDNEQPEDSSSSSDDWE